MEFKENFLFDAVKSIAIFSIGKADGHITPITVEDNYTLKTNAEDVVV